MAVRRLVFLGRVGGAQGGGAAALKCEGAAVEPGVAFELQRRRSRWPESRPHVRVIVGSHPKRADLLLEGDRVFPEHVRFYFVPGGDDPLDMMVIHADSTRLNGEPAPAHKWLTLTGGEEIELGPWRWRYEVVER